MLKKSVIPMLQKSVKCYSYVKKKLSVIPMLKKSVKCYSYVKKNI